MKTETNIVPWHQNVGQLNLIKRTFAAGATTDEFALFVGVAKRAGLDPFTRQIHMVKRGGQMSIQCGIDGYRAIAERSGTLAGIEDAVYDSEENLQPKKASVTVYRMLEGIRVSFTASARWSEYFPGEKLGFMWKKMPYLMLGKCAESLALRKAFPNDLSGLYTNEEMAQAGNTTIEVISEKEIKDIGTSATREEAEQRIADLDALSQEERIIRTIEVIENVDEIAEDVAKQMGGKVVEDDIELPPEHRSEKSSKN